MNREQQVGTVRDHYDNFLASRYTWMCGDFVSRVEQTRKWFDSLGLSPSKTALDLGCGSGIQSLALAKLGIHVTAVDFNESLLNELEKSANQLPIQTVHADLLELEAQFPQDAKFDAIVCMGDTLPHLPNRDSVEKLIQNSWQLLAPGGFLILEFRDLTTALMGEDRLIPVRLDDDELMLTFLEYVPSQVIVNDMALVRNGGKWELSKSSYPKLRLAPSEISACVESLGAASLHASIQRGVCRMVFKN